MAPDSDEPHIRLAVKDYVDGKMDDLRREIARDFVTSERARELVRENQQNDTTAGRWNASHLLALAALAIAVLSWLRP